MSTILIIRDMTDPEGRRLIPPRVQDPFRHKPVWAAYKFSKGFQYAEARNSEFSELTAAKATADALNINRGGVEDCYFKVYRLVPPEYTVRSCAGWRAPAAVEWCASSSAIRCCLLTRSEYISAMERVMVAASPEGWRVSASLDARIATVSTSALGLPSSAAETAPATAAAAQTAICPPWVGIAHS